jgi:hypothetical protein
MGKRVRRYLKLALAIVLVSAAVVWTADWLLLRRHIAQTQDAFGQVEVHRRYAIHLKGRRIEQRTEKPQMEECVHSMFPHYGESPCWYLERHADQTLDVDSGPWRYFSE